MKKISLSILVLITLVACNNILETNETIVANSSVEEQISEEVITEQKQIEIETEQEALLQEGTEVDDRYDHLCNETTVSDCYIVSNFINMDINYITVDFVSYRLKSDSKNTDYEEYELVNEIKTLRTFMVNDNYMTCGRNKTISTKDLIKIYEKDPKTIFSIETKDGITTELYIDNCSG